MVQLSQDSLETNWLATLSTQQVFSWFQKKKLLEDSGSAQAHGQREGGSMAEEAA